MKDWVDHARRWVPRPVRHGVQRVISLDEVKRRWRARSDTLSTVIAHDASSVTVPVRIGIFASRAQFHTHFVRACLEEGIAFRVIDLSADDWLDRVRAASCDAFLCWPDATQRPFAQLFKDRCDILEKELGLPLLPTATERWLYEDKSRQRDWMLAHDVPHPRTWVFFNRDEALAFVERCELPIVFKTAFGGGATGVKIVKSRRALRQVVRRAFGSGHVAAGHDHRDREWGRLLLQAHVRIAREWRMVRIGDSYFGHPKGRVGEFHSGSGRAEWDVPDSRLLGLLHDVTEAGGFRSMDVDVFEATDGSLLVNELQAVFGASTSIDQLRVDGARGRMVRDEEGAFSFEEGDFARNACANARLRDLLQTQFSIALPTLELA